MYLEFTYGTPCVENLQSQKYSVENYDKKVTIKDVIKENVDDDIGLHRLTVIAKPQKKEHRTDLKKERGTTLVAREENEGGSARQTGW